jgi:cell division protein ZapA (FtsZ GTPase activity inhibitor)
MQPSIATQQQWRPQHLQLRQHIGRLVLAEGAAADEQHEVGFHTAESLDVDLAALDEGQQVSLHTLCARIAAVLPLVAHDLVDLVDEHDAALLSEPATSTRAQTSRHERESHRATAISRARERGKGEGNENG